MMSAVKNWQQTIFPRYGCSSKYDNSLEGGRAANQRGSGTNNGIYSKEEGVGIDVEKKKGEEYIQHRSSIEKQGNKWMKMLWGFGNNAGGGVNEE